jgi:hypothetical protein
MKIQDIGFLIVLTMLLISRKERWFVYAGLISLVVAIPLFSKWVFFTAERLTWYAGAFFLVFILSTLVLRKEKV